MSPEPVQTDQAPHGRQERASGRADVPSQAQFHPNLRGKRVLLVEDNEINQFVAVEMLESMGVQVVVAGTGEEGLKLVMRGGFEAILMDIQMPGMDGYQATAQIRRDPRFTPTSLPIIAMTAHCLDDELEKALAAGMNAFICKPLEMVSLVNTLLRWLVPHPDSPATLSAPAELGQDDLPPQLAACLDTHSALQNLGNNLPLYLRLLKMMKANHADTVQKLRQATETGDWAGAQRLAHTLKGVAATVGATALAEEARQLEKELAAGQRALEKHLVRLETLLGEVIAVVQSLEAPQDLKPPPTPGSDPAWLGTQLRQLAQFLAESDGTAPQALDALLGQASGTEQEDELRALSQLVSRYDYDAALEKLQALAHQWQVSLDV